MAKMASLFLQPFVCLNTRKQSCKESVGYHMFICLVLQCLCSLMRSSYTLNGRTGPSPESEQKRPGPQITFIPLPRSPVAPLLPWSETPHNCLEAEGTNPTGFQGPLKVGHAIAAGQERGQTKHSAGVNQSRLSGTLMELVDLYQSGIWPVADRDGKCSAVKFSGSCAPLSRV